MIEGVAVETWLFPIADETTFRIKNKLSKLRGAAGFAERIESDASDSIWDISTNFKRVQRGDRLVVYSTKTPTVPPRIIGLGRVIEPPFSQLGRGPAIRIRWDVALTRQLCREPLDATSLAQKLPTTKPTVTHVPNEVAAALLQQLGFVDALDDVSVETDVEELIGSDRPPTEKKQLIAARLGQGAYRAAVARIERGCRLTGVTDPDHLRASHIKPWRDSNDHERLDGNNGLFLAPHVDHLFDRGYISFDKTGKVLISPKLPKQILKSWGVRVDSSVGPFNGKQLAYLEYHRRHVFMAE